MIKFNLSVVMMLLVIGCLAYVAAGLGKVAAMAGAAVLWYFLLKAVLTRRSRE